LDVIKKMGHPAYKETLTTPNTEKALAGINKEEICQAGI
jgi:hypothetical protein